jgi:hypothetical protein
MPNVSWLKIIKKPLAVTAIMLWAMVLGNQISTFMALIFGVAGYFAGLWVLRVIGEEEQLILGSLLPEKAARFLPVYRDGKPGDEQN